MALSGSKNYTDTYTGTMLARLALRRCGVLDPEQAINTTEQDDALEVLNLIIKELSVETDNWLRQSGVVWLTDPGNKAKYSLGPSGDPAAFSWYETKLSTDEATSSTSIDVSAVDTTHTIDTANIGIKLDDGSIHFTTISGAPSGTTITLTTGLPSAATTGNRVYTYNTSSAISRPKRLLHATRITDDTTNTSAASSAVEGIEADIKLIGRDEYVRLSQKLQTGAPTSVHYEPTIVESALYVWPTGTTSADYDKINLVYNIYPDDFDAASNYAQFPPEWHNALAYKLAWELAPEYGVSREDRDELGMRAEMKISKLLDYDVENASVKLELDSRRGNRRT